MSEAANSQTVSNAERASRDPLSDHPSTPVVLAKGEAAGRFEIDDGTSLGGHKLLSRPSLPQGRRSLFRR